MLDDPVKISERDRKHLEYILDSEVNYLFSGNLDHDHAYHVGVIRGIIRSMNEIGFDVGVKVELGERKR